MGQTPPKSLVMAKRWVAPKMCAIWVGCDFVQCENKVGIIKGIHSLNLQGESNPKGVQKSSQKDHLSINVTRVGTPT